eukprot:8329939-Pyramimonas_sp.AAC.1
MAAPPTAPIVRFVRARLEYMACMADGGQAMEPVAKKATEGIVGQIGLTSLGVEESTVVAQMVNQCNHFSDGDKARIRDAIESRTNMQGSGHAAPQAPKQVALSLQIYLKASDWAAFESDAPPKVKLYHMAGAMIRLRLVKANERSYSHAMSLALFKHAPLQTQEAYNHTMDLKEFVRRGASSVDKGPITYPNCME